MLFVWKIIYIYIYIYIERDTDREREREREKKEEEAQQKRERVILKSAEEGDFLANAIPFPPSYLSHTLRNLCITRKTRTRDT